MGQTASTIYRRYSPCALPIYRLLICGISASGKTSILYRLALPDKEGMLDVIPTIGFNIETFRADAAELTGWDLGGREKTRPLWRHYFEGSDAIVFVVDSSDRYTIDESRDEFRRLTSEEETRKLPVLLLCNKQDLPNAMTPEEVMEAFGLDAKSMEERPILVHGCSAKTNDGLDESINLLADCLVEAKAFGATKSIQHSLDDSSTRTDESTSTLSHSSLDTSVNVSRQNETLQNFSRIKKSTECPFAKRAKLWGGLVSAEAFSIEAQAASHIPPLIEFCERLAESESLDGFCIEIDDEVAAKGGPEEFGQCVRRMLSELSVNDPAGENVMAAKYIDRPGWRYRFHSTDFFVTTFAPCYSEISSRYGFGSDKAFILLQPESSFLRHKLPPDSAETDWNNPRNIREKTRVAFKNAGRPYYIPETTSYPIVEHIVKPICDDGKNVVRWWTEQ